MKKILITIMLIISLFSGISYVNAEGEGVKVRVTEKVPGANCDKGEGDPIIYTCTIEKGFGSVIKMMGNIIKYFTYLAGLFGVLFIILNGIMYSMGGIEQSMKDDAKKRITGTLIGLVLLFLSGVILNIIAPWIYK